MDFILKFYPREPRYKSILSPFVNIVLISVHILRNTYLSIKYLLYFLVVLYLRRKRFLAGEGGKLGLSVVYLLSV